MAQSGYTPIQLYRTATASAAPTAGNLADGELAINTADEKLYFKNAAGTVKLLAANVTPTANGGTGTSTTFTAGSVVFAGASGVYAQDNANLFWDDANNNLGIGTSSPSQKLAVVGSIKSDGLLFGSDENYWYQSAANNASLRVGTSTNTSYLGVKGVSGVPTIDGAGGALGLATSGTERMRIDSSGNVGIGTSSPGARLGINGGAGTSQTRFEVSTTQVQEVATNAAASAYADRLTDAAQHIWKVTGSERMRIDSSGNVGIGTSAPSQKLTVVDATSANLLLAGSTTSYITYAYSGFAVSGTASNTPWLFYTNNTERARIDTSGNVGIGTATPGSALDVKGTLRLSGATSGYVGLAPAAAAGSTTYTLPAADGTNGQALVTNGSGTLSWASATATGTLKNVQVFTSSGTYTRTSGVTTAVVIAVGGGGGGKGATGGAAGGNGGNGGTTSFGSHVSAAGGSGATSTDGGSGGTGGTGSTIAIKGQGGGAGNPYYLQQGIGGGQGGGLSKANGFSQTGTAGVRGGGGSGGSNGTACAVYFSGGGGGQGETAIKYTTTVGATETVTIGAGGTAGSGGNPGGAGGAGYIIVYEYS